MGKCVHVCLNGHFTISNEPLSEKIFCEICGAEMIDKCLSCDSLIKEIEPSGIVSVGYPEYKLAAYCRHCGEPYPWTQSALEATAEIIAEEDRLSKYDREKLIESLPDIISETPRTKLAIMRLKKACLSAGKFTAEALSQFAIQYGCEFVLKGLGL